MPKDESLKPRLAVHVRIAGAVQGVGFRYFVEEKARVLGVTGWVRNTADDAVEAEGEGDEVNLKLWLDLIRRGPPLSRVTQLTMTWQDPTQSFKDFSIRS